MRASVWRVQLQFGLEQWRRPGGALYGPGHALLLRILQHTSPSISQTLHDANVRKPFALSPLIIRARGNGIAEADLSICMWDQRLADGLTEALAGALDIRVNVSGAPAVVTDVAVASPVALESMLPDRPSPSVRVRFDSPTFFSLGRRAGHQQYGLLPVPELVVHSWLRAWRSAGGPVDKPLDVSGLGERLALREVHNLESQVVRGEKTALTGFTGGINLTWIGDEAWGGALLTALSRFAEYCGTGAKTGHGFGRTRVVAGQRAGRENDHG